MDPSDENVRASARLRKRLEANDYTPREYSGRGMGGKSCLGVTVDFVGDLLAELPKEAIRTAKQDAMGRQTIVYWPHLPWIAPAPKPEDFCRVCSEKSCDGSRHCRAATGDEDNRGGAPRP